MQEEGGISERRQDLSGKTVGRYQVHELLGRGAFGEVYLAQDQTLKRTVALKRIVPDLRGDPDYRHRLVREAESASRLNDPRITALYDVLETEDETLLVMEFVEGRTLGESLGEPMPQQRFLKIARQCAGALAVAHRGGVIHQDLKPDNIMLTASDEVKVCDFGLAKRMPRSDESTRSVSSSPVGGTPGYMAPEIAQGWEPDERSDIYSLGVIFYEMLAGRRPGKRMSSAPAGSARPLTHINPTVSRNTERMTERMLHPDPGERVGSAVEVESALERIDRHPFSLARPRSRVTFRTAATAAALVALGWIAMNIGRQSEPLSPPQPERLLIADFVNRTGDPFFDFTVSQLLTTVFQQSRNYAVIPRSQIIDTLERMQLETGDLDNEILSEVAVRANLDTLVTGEIDQADTGFQILVRAFDPRTESPKAVLTRSISSKNELPEAVDALFAGLAAQLGRGRQTFDEDMLPLPEVTTRSTDALERFSRALALRAEDRIDESALLLQAAVDIDPDFAMAHSQLAIAQSTLGDRDEALVSATRAYELRNRVGERERYLITATYHFLRAEFREAQRNYLSVVLLHPDDDYAYRYLMQVEPELGNYQGAISAADRLRELDPENSLDRQIMVVLLTEAGRFDDAIRTAGEARASGITGSTLLWGEGLAHLGRNRLTEAQDAFRSASQLSVNGGRLYSAQALIYEGRLSEAASMLEADLALDRTTSGGRFAGSRRYWLAEVYRLLGLEEQALAHLAVLADQDPSLTRLHQLRNAGLGYVKLGEIEGALSVLAKLDALRSDSDSELLLATIAQLRAELAWREGRVSDARRDFERANSLWPFPTTISALAAFLESEEDCGAALSAYEDVVERKGEVLRWDPASMWFLAHLGAARCLDALGRPSEAERHRDEVRSVWGDDGRFIDPGLHGREPTIGGSFAVSRREVRGESKRSFARGG